MTASKKSDCITESRTVHGFWWRYKHSAAGRRSSSWTIIDRCCLIFRTIEIPPTRSSLRKTPASPAGVFLLPYPAGGVSGRLMRRRPRGARRLSERRADRPHCGRRASPPAPLRRGARHAQLPFAGYRPDHRAGIEFAAIHDALRPTQSMICRCPTRSTGRSWPTTTRRVLV